MLQNNQEELTLLIYDNPKPPKCLKFNKKTLKWFMFFLPLLVTFSLLITAYVLANFKKLRLENELKQPQIITELKTEISDLEKKINLQNDEVKSLVDKISKGSVSTNEENVSLINLPLGYNNFLSKKITNIKEVKHSVTPSGTKIEFNIVNQLNEKKLSGYVFVIRITKNSFEVFPETDLDVDDFLLNYNKGESFTTYRFRPVEAKFSPIKSELYTYKIIIFSKLGDLIYKQNFGPYKNE